MGTNPGRSAVRPQQSYRKLSATNRTNSLTCVFVALPSQLDGTNTNNSGLKIRTVWVRVPVGALDLCW